MLNSIILKIKKVRITGSASLNMCYVADARFDAYLENGIMLWDIAAGSVILEEAGGRMDKIAQYSDYSVDVVAGNGKVNLQLLTFQCKNQNAKVKITNL
jgi:myo-inositol-1(or 4)-monophosphatase